MSIKTLIFAEFIQDFTVAKEDKLLYGEIYSPFSLIKNMLGLFDQSVFSNKYAKWLDTGAGSGFFSMVLFDQLNKGLSTVIYDEEERKTHIIENMLYMIELKPENIVILKERFGNKANIIHIDFLSYTAPASASAPIPIPVTAPAPAPIPIPAHFDYIIGNPPYNAHGMKKVPTNNKDNKKQDGQTVWGYFIKKSLTLLKPHTGQLCYIVPSIWMKPDKANIYYLLSQYKIEKLHCLSNTETNKLFKGEAQTPTCYFLLTNNMNPTNMNPTKAIQLFDKCRNAYVDYNYCPPAPLPLFGQTVIQKLQPFILKAGGCLKVLKTNMPSKNTVLSQVYDGKDFPYINITTCQLVNSNPTLIINYSNEPQSYYKEIKLVLAHKMYGFPYLDEEGVYGISNRDNYVILKKTKSLEDLKQLKAFLSTKIALYIYEATRYRMKYLEKYAFDFIPDINNLLDFPTTEQINDKSVATYFGLDAYDEQNINSCNNYGCFK